MQNNPKNNNNKRKTMFMLVAKGYGKDNLIWTQIISMHWRGWGGGDGGTLHHQHQTQTMSINCSPAKPQELHMLLSPVRKR